MENSVDALNCRINLTWFTLALDIEGKLFHSLPSNCSAVLVPISEAQTGFTCKKNYRDEI